MNENILIGIGGTGAKVVESVLPLMLAGLGPDEVSIGFIDQDQSNGNVARAKEFLDKYVAFREDWSGSNNQTKLDWTTPVESGGTMLGRKSAKLLAPGGQNLWCPHIDPSLTLNRIFQKDTLPKEYQYLMDLLYDPKAEQNLPLENGYRAHPNVGAAAMTARQLEGDDEFWKKLYEKIRKAANGQPVRVFLAGSVFGGTGAAGFPTIAKIIKHKLKTEKNAEDLLRNVSIGGVLLLPYFSFTTPDSQKDNVAKSEQLMVQSVAALKYYDDLLAREKHIFDAFYLVGMSPLLDLGYFNDGGKGQANPPLPMELVAALAALHFFKEPSETEATQQGAYADDDSQKTQTKIYIAGHDKKSEIHWNDLPRIDDAGDNRIYQRMSQLLRFCAMWRNTMNPVIDPKYKTDAWFRRQEIGKVDFKQNKETNCLKSLNGIVNAVLIWATTMYHYGIRGGQKQFDLWNAESLGDFDETNPVTPVSLHALTGPDAPAERLFVEAFDKLIRAADEKQKLRDQASVYDGICTKRQPGNHNGFGRIVAAVFENARI